MQKTSFFLIWVILFTITSCYTSKLNPEMYDGKQIVFGNGGGFAGAYTEYVLQENGDLFRKESIKEDFSWIKRLKKNETEQVFENFNGLGIGAMEINKPGNMYYFVGMNESGKSSKLVWGDEILVDKNLQLYYRILMHLVKD